jgi:hypothetical protein
MSEFYKYFKENMAALNLPAPESLFGSAQTALGTATAMITYVDKFGPKVTVGELIGAGTRLEGLTTVGVCLATYYVGAVIGSLAVATGRCLGKGTSLGDVLLVAAKYGLSRPWLAPILQRCPGIYRPSVATRFNFKNYAAFA